MTKGELRALRKSGESKDFAGDKPRKSKRVKPYKERKASRQEQHARYIDSGHNDDTGESPDY
ncbi:hypothetical protein LCGC14_2786270 [marine sediment metagenome]|uniref:Uncharacterized protein n=1 Tax=marine sediment metagenome TaxID=412755 RepID=A0A0F8YRV3_9ZZZZ